MPCFGAGPQQVRPGSTESGTLNMLTLEAGELRFFLGAFVNGRGIGDCSSMMRTLAFLYEGFGTFIYDYNLFKAQIYALISIITL